MNKKTTTRRCDLKNIKNIPSMINKLRNNPLVIGIVEFGKNSYEQVIETGDYDLFVVLEKKNEHVKVFQFFINETLIDMNLITLDEIDVLKINNNFELNLLNGKIIYDPTGKVSEATEKLLEKWELSTPNLLSEHLVAQIRNGHRHYFEKIRNRSKTEPLLCHILLMRNMHWNLLNYFRVRNYKFKGAALGERKELEEIRKNDISMYELIEQFYATTDIDEKIKISIELTEKNLQPCGGMMKNDEIITRGNPTAECGHVGLTKLGMIEFKKIFPSLETVEK
ncbi:MAG: hypothetical protein HQK52_18180 [Oligoflexia bacterium]|nr:hypothetical protein [Oligoflexia bacterium]